MPEGKTVQAEIRARTAWVSELLRQGDEADPARLDEALEHLRWLLERWRSAQMLGLAGAVHAARFRVLGGLPDLNAAVSLLSEVEPRAEAEGEELALTWENHAMLAQLREQRYRAGVPVGGYVEDAQAMVLHWRRAVELCDGKSSGRELRVRLALALAARATGWPPTAEEDEREADELLSEAKERWPAGDGGKALIELTLGRIRLARGLRTERRAYLDTGIDLIERTLHTIAAEDPGRRDVLSDLATAYAVRGGEESVRADLEQAAHWLREARLLIPGDDLPARAENALRLGDCLFMLAVEPDADGAEAMETLRLAVELLGPEHTVAQVAKLGTLHLMRYMRAAQSADRDAAVEWLGRAVADSGLDPEFAAVCRSGLGMMLMDQAMAHWPDHETLDLAIQHLEQAPGPEAEQLLGHARDMRALSTEGSPAEVLSKIEDVTRDLAALRPGDPAGAPLKSMLARLVLARDARQPSPESEKEAVGHLEEALTVMGEDDPERAPAMELLSKLLLRGIGQSPAEVDLERVLALVSGSQAPDVPFVRLFAHAFGALRDGDDASFDSAVAELRSIQQETPGARDLIATLLGLLLSFRFARTYSLDDLDAGQSTLSEVRDGVPGIDATMLRMMRGGNLLTQGLHRHSPEVIQQGIDELAGARRQMPPGHPGIAPATALLAQAERSLKLIKGEPVVPDDDRDLTEPAEGVPFRGLLLHNTGNAAVERGRRLGDLSLVDSGLAQLTEAGAEARRRAPALADMVRISIATGLVARHRLSGERADLDRGIDHFEQVRDVLPPGRAGMGTLMLSLAEAYRLRGDEGLMDARRGLDTGLMALRERYGMVMTQTGTERALSMSKQTSGFALKIASWALDDGHPGLAVHALELGRGLVLAAGTATESTGALLRELGEHALAAEWEQSGEQDVLADPGILSAPSTVRSRVLARLRASDVMAARLLDPPSIREIAAALADTDALVYLLPPRAGTAGRAVLVRADGQVAVLPLPALDEAAVLAIRLFAGLPESDEQWSAALEGICDLAQQAVVGPLLEHAGGVSRLILVPWGPLGIVPWHAARVATADGHRYASQDVFFSIAASARQLLTVLARPALAPALNPLIVADPAGDPLRWARWECDEIHRLHYPGAQRFGRWKRDPLNAGSSVRVEPATARTLLPWLPGGAGAQASVLHFGGHASSEGSSAESYLQAADERLTVDRILRQARGVPADEPGGIIVLSACTSDLAKDDHDEALTLATAFLAAGAVSVTGSRWSVGDDPRTVVMMAMFHHHLRQSGSPAEALRLTRLWMLDEQRTTPADLAPEVRAGAAALDLTAPAIWAAFTHQGQ